MTRERDRIQENANKYIVRNCPAFGEMAGECYLAEIKPCYECPDCVIKQVIEKCKENLRELETYMDVRSYPCTMLRDILQLFDIEEINK